MPAGLLSFSTRESAVFMRNLVYRADGKLVNVVRRMGHLLVCTGCCCGHTERGHAAVPTDLYHDEWERRRLRNSVHLTIGGCLGPCALANVVELVFAGHTLFFHSVDDEATVLAIYDYIEQMVAAEAYLPPPPALAGRHFTAVAWEGRPDGVQVEDRRAKRTGDRPGLLFLTHADTDLLSLQAAIERLPPEFPPVRAYNLANLATHADVDAFLDAHLPNAEMAIVRVHGGRTSFAHGFDRLVREAQARDLWLLCLPGTDALDPELTALSNAGVPVLHELFAYLQFGGVENMAQALRFLADHLFTTGFGYEPPAEQPRHGVYHPDVPEGTLDAWRQQHDPALPVLGLLFYRAHLLAGNTAFVDAIVRAGERAGFAVLPVYAYSLKDGTDEPGAVPAPLRYFDPDTGVAADAIVSTLSFSIGGVNPDGPTQAGWNVEVLESLDVPVFQALTVAVPRARWQANVRGLSPVEAAMNVVLPEFDGRISTVPVSFKEDTSGGPDIGTPVVRYVPDAERIEQLMAIVGRTVALRRKPNHEKRVAVVLTNSTARISRIGNAVGLDAPASLLRLLERMRDAGYQVGDLPPDGDTLIHDLIDRCSYDVEYLTPVQLARAAGHVSEDDYARWFYDLPPSMQREIGGQWGPPPGVAYVHDGRIALAGLAFGNVFVALQPPRGYGMDPNAIYHMPDLPPPHSYHALYRWLRGSEGWGADAIVHLGKHGTLEWLPGKAVAPAETCYPDQLLAGVPLIYPFIINDPGEGTQAKRRAHAVIVDHMTPPMTAAGSYGDLAELAQLVDEYYQAEVLDPAKLPVLQRQIWDVMVKANLDSDMAMLLNRNTGSAEHMHEWDPTLTEEGAPATMEEMRGKDVAHLIQEIDGYLCELAGAQIRDGLHILGEVPDGEALIALLAQLVRLPNVEVSSLRAAVAAAYGLDLDTLVESPGARLPSGSPFITAGDALQEIDDLGLTLLRHLAEAGFDAAAVDAVAQKTLAHTPTGPRALATVATVLRFICQHVLPRLRQTDAEIEAILRALDGRYVPAGPSGAPTRGMVHVLPTGRNFYAVDPRSLPSAAAWRVGQDLADALLRRHLADEGRYPESVGLSIWGTSAMRTHGDDIAEVFALLGVRPIWQAENHRLAGVEAIPLAELGRPRIDVVCRISGFFRDAFPGVIAVLDEAVRTVALLDEPEEQNFVRKHVLMQQRLLAEQGVVSEEAERRARYRVFGCKPGTYGAGILPLIDERNWQGVADFAEAYVNWGGYAYTGVEYGVDARRDFETQLSGVQVAAKNQDNREHDIFDSDDYLQYHGGMIATIRALTGAAPRQYFGDSADPSRPRVRDLKEEARRVFRSRVVNPKWIASIQRHGYKGGLELASTVDYLFGYDATAGVLEDWMYERLTEAYLTNDDLVSFLERSNPWALRDMAERLLEAIERGLWMDPSEETLWVIKGIARRPLTSARPTPA
jgi:cobaltochelatase CobN